MSFFFQEKIHCNIFRGKHLESLSFSNGLGEKYMDIYIYICIYPYNVYIKINVFMNIYLYIHTCIYYIL